MDNQNADHEDGKIDQLDDVALPEAPLTMLKINELLEDLISDGRLFHLNDEGVTRYFVQRLFNVNAWKLNLGQLRELIAKVDGIPDDIPPELEEVPKWVRKELFELEFLPREKLAELYDWASEDLSAILDNVAECEDAIKPLINLTTKTDENLSNLRLYNYYLKLNQTAKDEIVQALTPHRIHRKAFLASYGSSSMASAFSLFAPWSFRRYPKRFKPSSFSQIRHAFGRLPLREFPEVQRLYEAEDPTQFNQRLERFIADANPLENIRLLLEEHHLLADRKRVLLPALKAYEREEFELFISATATQIEGIIEDICLLSGISVEKFRRGSIIEKLDNLDKKPSIYIDYAYYACKFPILRNRIAHGHMLKDDPRRIAHLLLLDLYDCCQIVRSHPGTPNALVELLRRVKSDMATFADVVEFAAIYAETKGKRPDDFYNLAQEFEEYTLLLDRQATWDFLHELLGLRKELLGSR